MVTKDLGMVTAYAYAVAGGYTGTEAQFEQLMADLAIVVDDFDNFSVTVTTLPAGSSATASYSDGVLSLGIPKGDKGDKGNTGNTGATPNLSVGTVETTAEPMVTITGTAENPVLNFGLVKGDKGDTGEVSEAELTETLEDYARIDGYYQDMSVGSAEQLISTVSIEDSVPYKFRTSGGSVDIGDRETDMIVGGTIAWNQKVENGNFASASGWSVYNANASSISISDNVCTQTVATVPTNAFALMVQRPVNNNYLVVGHKYFVGVDVLASKSMGFLVTTNGNELVSARNTVANTWTPIRRIVSPTRAMGYFGVYPYNTSEIEAGDVYKYRNAQIFDLTQMFGSTIADYIYSLETANAGAGVSFFRSLFPKPYYEYNAGELLSVSGLQSHDMVGFNQLDYTDYAIASNTTYHVSVGTTLGVGGTTATVSGTNPLSITNTQNWRGALFFSKPLLKGVTYRYSYRVTAPTKANVKRSSYLVDGNNVVVRELSYSSSVEADVDHVYGTTFTPDSDGLRYVLAIESSTQQTITLYDLCLNISWDGERDGEYEPYTINSYALDDSLTLRGIPKLDASNNLYYDGDTYEADGTVTRKYGIVDLGTLRWVKYSSLTYDNLFYAAMPTMRLTPSSYEVANILCVNYKTTTQALIGTIGYTNKYISGGAVNAGNARFWLNDEAYTEASAIKSALNGVMAVYELATPTTETADPYTSPQIVDDFGTEEYVTNSIVPVGHVTQYMNNLRAKLEMAPESPSGDGDYIVRQTSGENSYVSLASTTTIQSIIARLEALEGGNE